MSDEDDVRRLALELPEVAQHPEGFSFNVHGLAFAWSFMQRVAPKKPRVRRPDILAVRVSGDVEKQSLIDVDPSIYFTDEHYRGYPAVLVRLPDRPRRTEGTADRRLADPGSARPGRQLRRRLGPRGGRPRGRLTRRHGLRHTRVVRHQSASWRASNNA